MDLISFKNSLSGNQTPADLSPYLQALWFDGKNDWEKAHQLAQEIGDREGAWIHAYLHRKEGDPGNARYWYDRAGRSMPAVSLEKEWEDIVRALL